MLIVNNKLPEGFSKLEPYELHQHFKSLDIVELNGVNPHLNPLILSLMLHGNEPAGLRAIQNIMDKYEGGQSLPRPVVLLIGNVDAARDSVRMLEGSIDYNRIWKRRSNSLIEHKAEQILNHFKSKTPFAVIDIHNNTGSNPAYGCFNKLSIVNGHLARLFSETSVYFTNPDTTLSVACCAFCPALTVECGLPGDISAEKRAFNLINELLNRESLSKSPLLDSELTIYHSYAIIRVPKNCTISFSPNADTDFYFKENLDFYNFKTLKFGETIGYRNNPEVKLQIVGVKEEDLSDDFFDYIGKKITVKKAFIPSMLTCNTRIISQDCLGYIMESYSVEMLK